MSSGSRQESSIPGWITAGSHPQDYETGVDRTTIHNGKTSGYIKCSAAKARGFGTLMQTFRGSEYLGKQVRLSAYVKSEQVEEWTGLWMRVDGPNQQQLSFDNMQDRAIQGTTDWQCYEIVLDVPETAIAIAFGVLLAGKGQVWVDNFQFEVVDSELPTTNMQLEQQIPLKPQNLDFEV